MPPPPPDAPDFVLALGRAMHAHGSPSYRVEDSMDAAARALGLSGQFFATPTAIFAALQPAGGEARTVLQRVQPGSDDLGRLTALYAVRDAVVRDGLSPTEGLRRLDAVLAAPALHGPGSELSAWALVGMSAVAFLGGGLGEVLAATAIALVVGALARAVQQRPRALRVFDPAAALVATLLAQAAAAPWQLDPTLITIASIIALLPGLSFTTALAELSMRHLAAGSARLLGALATLLTMAVGVGVGSRLGVLCFGAVEPATRPLPVWALAPSLLVAAVAFTVVFRASWRQLPAVLLGLVAGHGGALLGGLWFDRELGAFVGALALGLAANAYSHLRRRPGAVVRTPGLLLLVPGSLGFRGLHTALQQDFAASSQFAFQMLLVGGAIVAGLLVAGAVLPPPLDVEPDSAGS